MDGSPQPPGIAAGGGDLWGDPLAACTESCPHARRDPASCPLPGRRSMDAAAIVGWLGGLSREARDYLIRQQQCSLVIDDESRRSSGRQTGPLASGFVQSSPNDGASAARVATEAVRPEACGTETLSEAFCRRRGCAPAEYHYQVFLLACYPVARWWARWGGYHADHFALDRALVSYCGVLRSLPSIDRELEEYSRARENGKFLRQVFRLRVSRHRFRRMAAACLAD